MQDAPPLFDTPLDGMNWQDWVAATAQLTGDKSYTQPLGPDHAAIFLEKGRTLLVSFEAHHRLEDMSDVCHPVGWQMVKSLGWSHLCLASAQDTWFRAKPVYAFFDRLIDDGFFDEFDRVVFYGAGSCGYAAAAFSVAAPDARVLAIQPQATLDPRVAEWDDRFVAMRRTSFTDRFGYAPDMLDAAHSAFVFYDPEIEADAMHAALFTRPNVEKFRMRHLGSRVDADLMRMGILLRMLARLSADKLDTLSIAQLYRARRITAGYQYTLLRALTRDDRHRFTQMLANHVLKQRNAPPFRKALQRAEHMLQAGPARDAATQTSTTD